MTDTTAAPGRFGAALATTALALGLLCAAGALLAGPLYRIGVLPLGGGIGTVRWAATGALVGAALGLIALLTGGPRGRASAALVLNLLVAAPPLWMYRQVQTLPRIHDISTDTADPPAFVAVLPLRAGARNPVDWKPETAAPQKAGYPDLAPLVLPVPPALAMARAERAARAMGWAIVAVQAEQGRLEATDTTRLFGFQDDVVIRVRPQGSGSVVDVRSLSRVGGSDFGTNAKRVREVLRRISAP